MNKFVEQNDQDHAYYAFPNRGEMLLKLATSALESFRNRNFEGASEVDSEAHHTTATNHLNS